MLYRLPLEIFRHIIDSMGEDAYPMSMVEGRRIRREFEGEEGVSQEAYGGNGGV